MSHAKMNESFRQQQIQRELEMERQRKKTQKKFNETKKANVELNEAIQDITTLKIWWAVGGKNGANS